MRTSTSTAGMPIRLASVITGAAYLPFWLGSTAPFTMRTSAAA